MVRAGVVVLALGNGGAGVVVLALGNGGAGVVVLALGNGGELGQRTCSPVLSLGSRVVGTGSAMVSAGANVGMSLVPGKGSKASGKGSLPIRNAGS